MKKYFKPVVISAFPACGKTYAFNHYNRNNNILDSDSSLFSRAGEGVRNPSFPQNYIDHIKAKVESEKYDIIFVSSHKEVRDLMTENGIKFYTVYPESDLMDEWVERMKNRGNDDEFISFITNNWNNFMEEIECGNKGIRLFRLKSGQYLDSDMITHIEGLSAGEEYHRLVEEYENTLKEEMIKIKNKYNDPKKKLVYESVFKREYDDKGREIYTEHVDHYKSWSTYDDNNNLIHYKKEDVKNPYIYEEWYEYNEQNKRIHYKNTKGIEDISEYSDDGKKVHTTHSGGCDLFEIWLEYNDNGDMIHYKDSNGTEQLYTYNEDNILVSMRSIRSDNSTIYEGYLEYDDRGNTIYHAEYKTKIKKE